MDHWSWEYSKNTAKYEVVELNASNIWYSEHLQLVAQQRVGNVNSHENIENGFETQTIVKMTNRYSCYELDDTSCAGSPSHYRVSMLGLSVVCLIYGFVLVAEEATKHVGQEHDGKVLPETDAVPA